MNSKRSLWIVTLAILAGLLLTACGGAAGPAASEEPGKVAPDKVKIGLVFGATADEAWYKSLLQSMDRFNEDNEYGLTIDYDFTENVWGDDAERALRAYADTGEYDILWPASSYSDQVKNMMDEYPEIMFVYSGSGNEGLGGNAFWTYNHIQECAYLLGVTAGLMTESNVIGAVAGFPYDDVNDVLNGYIDGAKAVNEDVEVKVTFIESWWDPPLAKEATYAQIAAGADYVYAERFGPYEALAEKGVYGFGQYEDQSYLAPEVVVTSTLLFWDPVVEYIIDNWWAFKVEGVAFNASVEPVWFSMADGACDIAPFHEFDDVIPQDVKDLVAEIREEILAGSLVVPLNIEPPETN
jgi:basic membrane lipoprotein Med (substrate-binding protein (PBP1-ABC) superfamily)